MTIDIDAIRQRWHQLLNAPQPGLVTDRLIFAEQSADDVPDLIREVEQQRANAGLLNAQLQTARAQVADLADKLHKADAEVHSLEKATTAYANENEQLKDRISDLEAALSSTENAKVYAQCSADLLRGHLDEQKPLIEAAKAWRAQFAKPAASKAPRMRALIEAVDALPQPTHWPSIYGGCEDDCPLCKTEKAEVA